MEKLIVQRKIEVWVEETYNVEEINDATIDSAIDYDLDPYEEETLWETQVDLGPVEVYDDKRNIIYSNIRLDNE